MYQAHLLLNADTDFTLDEAQRRLVDKFPDASFARDDRSLVLSTDDWEISFIQADGPEVLADSQRVAEHVTGAEDEQGISACDRRIEIGSDIPDPEMEHFEKFQRVIEVMQTFRGAFAIDPREPCVL
jgi:hypothetical protein